MAQLTQFEDVVEAVIAQLQAELPAKLAAIAEAKSDGLPLDAPAVEQYYRGERRTVEAFPTVWVVGLSNEVVAPREVRTAAALAEKRLVIAAILSDTDETALIRRVYRTVLGIQRVLDDHPTLNGRVGWIGWEREDYSPLYSAGSALVKDGHLEVRVRTAA